ncbi:cation-transporting P-type ATPase [Tautonia sp. JC769]|uniref:cation-transporting P-type ATPase n=1 Tax=Tautonia sp. JC769 TaxID=3232135 RepID=UPI003458EFED
MRELLGKHWHHLPAEEVFDYLETDPAAGLDLFAIGHRREQFGANVLAPRPGTSPLVLFAMQFHQPLVYILIAAGVVTAILEEWVDAGVILGVVLVNAVIGFVQESKALRAIESLARGMSSEATVIRAGEARRLPAGELVPGDVVLLQSGDKVPADLRLFRCRSLQADESALTGESVPASKEAGVLPREAPLAEHRNMAYSSTLVTFGTGSGVVVATGDQTEIGRINELIAATPSLETPLTRDISAFSRTLLYVILGLAALTFAVGLLRGRSWIEMFMASVALAVGAIPEGLPAAVTITLAVGMKKMARRNAIIRKLPAVETLGSTTMICSDKTGTLTQNQMTVQQAIAGGTLVSLSGAGYDPEGRVLRDGEPLEPGRHEALWETFRAGVLCQDSRLVRRDEQWQVEGDPTEGALIVAARKAGLDPDGLADAFPRLDAIPFESQHQYMATLHHVAGGGGSHLVYVKGGIEEVLRRCDTALQGDGGVGPLDAEEVHRRVGELARRGLRVLGFARKTLPGSARTLDASDVAGGLTFLGLQAMMDPPRPAAVSAIETCQRAGVRVKMITGDHAWTASAIATEIGLQGAADEQGRLLTLTGQELARLGDRALIEEADRVAVFARVSPEQKLRLVEALQARGNVVAMTGDGVNDAPALRQADLGIAMGITGTEVAKEAADMVLADDNFASIEAAVEEGRGVYDNLVKFITWTLPTNIGEGLVILVAIVAGARLPILPVQILWINMTTAVLLGLMLAFEPKEPGIMLRPPRDPRTPVLTRPLVFRIALVGLLLLAGSFGLFEWEQARGGSLAEARTVAVNVFVVGGIFYLLNCRSLRDSFVRVGLWSNPWIVVGVAIMIALQLAFTYLPAMNAAFSSAPIGPDEWGRIVVAGASISLVIGAEKWIRRRWSSAAATVRSP